MTTQVKIEHEGGSHPVCVKVQLDDGSVRENVLQKAGDVQHEYVYPGQTITIEEVKD